MTSMSFLLMGLSLKSLNFVA